MFQSYGLLSQIAARLSGRDSSVPQRKPAVWGDGTGLTEHDDRENGALRSSTVRTQRTLHHEDRANAVTEEVPLWFGWWQ